MSIVENNIIRKINLSSPMRGEALSKSKLRKFLFGNRAVPYFMVALAFPMKSATLVLEYAFYIGSERSRGQD